MLIRFIPSGSYSADNKLADMTVDLTAQLATSSYFLGDSHEANKCPKPFDKRTFNKNRAQFLATGLQYGRYHREDKNKNSKAGVLSDSLRRALGRLPNI